MTVPAPSRFFRLLPALGAAGLCVVASRPAAAQTGPFSEGIALSPIEPAPAGDRFFLTPDAATDAALPEEDDFPLRAMVFSHLTLNPSLRRTVAGTTQDIVERQLFVHAGLAFTPVSWLLLHADLPIAALQQGQGATAPGAAVGDLRLGARVGLVGDRNSAFSLAPAVDVWAPTGSQDDLTSDGNARVLPKLVVSGKAGVFVYAANVGFLFRKHFYSGSTEIGNSLTFGAAAGLSLFDDVLQLGPELQGTSLVESQAAPSLAFEGRTSPISAVFGARVQVGDFNIGAGYGPGLTEAPGNASRVFLSLTFVPVAHGEAKISAGFRTDRDGDGIFDSEDACPDERGPNSAIPESRGCPDHFDESVDSDGDDIADSSDACPELLGSPSEDPAKHGCPEVKTAPPPAPVPTAPSAPSTVVRAPTATATPAPPAKKPVLPFDPSKGPPVATFVGFRELGSGSVLVFVELTKEVAVEPVQKGRVLEYRMAGTKVTLRNNRNPLLASHFDSVVESAQLVPDGKSVKLVIKLRRDADALARVERHAQGATLKIELTARAPAQAPAAARTQPAPKP